jgi:hypothetical protein
MRIVQTLFLYLNHYFDVKKETTKATSGGMNAHVSMPDSEKVTYKKLIIYVIAFFLALNCIGVEID